MQHQTIHLAEVAIESVGMSAAEKVLLAVGIVLTLMLIVLFMWIIRMARNDTQGGEGDQREKL